MKKYVITFILSFLILCGSAFVSYSWIQKVDHTYTGNSLLISELETHVSNLDIDDSDSVVDESVVSDFDFDRVKADKQVIIDFFNDICDWSTDSEYKNVRMGFLRFDESFTNVFLPDKDMTGMSMRCDVSDVNVMSIEDDVYSYFVNVYWYVVDGNGKVHSNDSIVLLESNGENVLSNFEAY